MCADHEGDWERERLLGKAEKGKEGSARSKEINPSILVLKDVLKSTEISCSCLILRKTKKVVSELNLSGGEGLFEYHQVYDNKFKRTVTPRNTHFR